MNKLFLLIIAIFFGCVLSTGMMDAPKISNTDFDCTIQAIKHCGTDDTVCQDRVMKQCGKKTTVEDGNYSHSYHKKHHTYKTSIEIRKEIEDSDDEQAQRICITDANCNCRTFAKATCENCENPKCYADTLNECETRCRKSRRCYRMDCKNAGKTRCHRDIHLQCSLEHPDSHHKRTACIEEKSSCCIRHEKATCQRAIRVYKFRTECTEESKAKCFGITDEKAKCTCITQTRHTCLVQKVEKHRQSIREVFDCEDSARMICSEKKCGPDYQFCIKKEKSICEPVCHKESRKECNNQVNGICYEQSYKRCIHKWKKTYCEKRAEYKCGQDDECLSREKHHCKRIVPDCMTGLQSCDDKNKCTEDICHPTQGCINKQINCDDNNACTTESCDPALGCVYKTKKCDDGKLCTTDSCNPVTGQCKFVYDDKICHVCANGYCEKDLDCAAWEKAAKLADSCQKAVCNPTYGSCEAVHVKKCANKCKLSCQPYHACDVATCVLNKTTNEYECVHSDKVCNDHKSCTIDTCDNKLGCVYKFNKDLCPPNPLCESDSECTAWETSNNLRNKCQKAICDKHKGICLAVSTSNECDEPVCLASCKPRHSCETAKCAKNENGKYHCVRQPVICDDKKECTVDTCDQNLGCVFTYKADDKKCKPGLSCEHTVDCKKYELNENLAKRCLKAVCDVKLGACVTSPIDEKCDKELKECELNCKANGICQKAYCAKDEGNRYYCQRDGRTCDDGITCTVDTCDDKLGCVHTYKPDPVNCPVGGECKRDSDCVTWGFTQNLGQQCKRPVCDIKTGACRAVAKVKKCVTQPECQLTCKAQNACETAICDINTEGDYYCKRVSKTCNDNDDCTLDTCDATTGNCLFTPTQSDKCNKCTQQSDCEALSKKLSVDCKSAYCDTNTKSCKVVPSQDSKCLDRIECLKTCVAQSKCEVATCVYDETKKKHSCQRTKSNDSSCTKQNECELNCKPTDLCETTSCVQLADGSYSCVRASNTCNDNKSCTKDSCDGTTGKCVNTYVVSDKCLPGAYCEKNLDCAKWASQQELDVCLTPVCDVESGSCKAVPNKYKCSSKVCNKECPPRNACEESTCAYDKTTKKLVCEYVRKSCDDKNRCTVDSCDISKGCVNTFDKTVRGCDTPRCETPKDCVQYAQDNKLADDCKDAICDAETKTCKAVLIDNPKCNPSFNKCRRECKPRSACETSACIIDADTKKFKCSLSSITCNDNNPCTVDVCDPVKGCKYTYTVSDKCEQYCTDNNDCVSYGIRKKASLSCQVPYCDKTTTTCKLQDDPNKNCKKIDIKCELVCKPKDACHTARCVRKGDNELACVQEPITCNDGKTCTEDSCDSKKGCQFTFKQSKTCKKPCAVDIDCDNWAITEKLADKCEKAVCSRETGSCISVQGPQTEKCKTTDQCKLTSDCPQDGFGSVCCQENGVRQCCKNQCETDLDCVPKDKKKEWGYCRVRDSGKRECEFLPKCTGNDGCDDKNPCTKDVCMTEYGFCKNIRRCVDNSECTLDICEPGKDGKSYTCKNPVKTCTNDKTLLDKNYDLLTSEQKTKWLGKCSHLEGCITCVVNKQCDDNNGCTEDSCVNQFCVSKPIDNKWCDPKLKGQAITVQGYFPKFIRL